MAVNTNFDIDFVKKIALLSHLTLTSEEAEYFSSQFNKTLKTISDLKSVKTDNVPEAYNITSLKNVFREDSVDSKRILTQKEALSNTKRAYNGFFVVKGILDEK